MADDRRRDDAERQRRLEEAARRDRERERQVKEADKKAPSTRDPRDPGVPETRRRPDDD